MKLQLISLTIVSALLAGCATGPVTHSQIESPYSEAEQLAAQSAVNASSDQLALKRKIAVARLSNETTYGKGLLSGSDGSDSAEKISDMFIQSLTNSGNYLIFERRDIELLESEAQFSGLDQDFVGVDTLVIGSLTEFGRSTTGTSGFFSSTKKQQATATIALRLVDVASGQVIHSLRGSGIASTETQSTLGFGSVASYDGSINDRAIGTAVNAAVGKLDQYMLQKPWSADVLDIDDGLIFISGGQSQGLFEGLKLAIYTKGKQVKSATAGTTITLPGQQIATAEVIQLFGDTELTEGAILRPLTGNINGLNPADLRVIEGD
ncbi:CsgG/HfaB family protein [Reinekea thalattae]|uniref:Curli production assembly/transport component CsgG n=1 Tax=Reinekea thalattae TaxID=2593301 RepID=A0A5C8Z8D1_9GAMM|nr:CsgG/HfaB family protein [Reinekea thalattae]TXR54375.1 curli production assembly protein CsgG [Reinekea thalattae]